MQKEKIEVSKVLEPLMNQILFGDSKRPVFDLKKSKLSDGFNYVYSNYKKPSGIRLIENHIETQILFVLEEFTQNERALIVQLIFNDPIFIESMMAMDILPKKDKSAIKFDVIEDKIRTAIEDYYHTGNVNIYINWYFKLFFDGLFYFDFMGKDYAIEKDYQNLYVRFTKVRSLLCMS